ncbi:MAG TPA: 4Fe-4S binding protein [Eubacteriales bacterium]|jgi:ferredoxin|nr:4Fe-4S binding protein [Clostridia bacterium]HRR90077.1 4Fe-4S binding protein [Eubacteriales bacterium]HRU83926.1 4Fe-4S binding protein [Eubacteriales bacterium]
MIKKNSLLEKIDDKLVNYFGNYCEVRSLDFFLKWAEATKHPRYGKLLRRLYQWFTKYYAGFVVPVNGSLGRGNAVMPYESILELVKRAKVGQIWPCSCKSFRPTKDDTIPRATCMLIAEVASLDNTVTKYPDTGYLPAEKVIETIKECEDIGLIHQIMCVSSPQGRKMYVLCNCDNKACVPMTIKCEYDLPMVRSSGFVVEEGDLTNCASCGTCAKRCLFSAIEMKDGKPVLAAEKCMGCGLCVTTCPQKLRTLKRLSREPFHDYTVEQIKNHPERTVAVENGTEKSGD